MMPFEFVARADYDRALARMARRAALAEHDRRIVQYTQQVIRRSRELLEETKHQVLPASQRE
jgi:predicted thioredoxin/glutaredoxin